MKLAIFTEDRYGLGFIKATVDRLIAEKRIQKVEFVKTYTPSLIKKCHNVRKVKPVIRDRILIIIDKENTYNYDEDKDCLLYTSPSPRDS